jgi:prefoldin subunit 5|tara:strand:- start:1601 stop:1834 length:234 start_codon:yes stop_codon:yes gene_type:complete
VYWPGTLILIKADRSHCRLQKVRELFRIEKAYERAESTIERTQNRLARHIERLNDRVHDLLRRLAERWRDARAAAEG